MEHWKKSCEQTIQVLLYQAKLGYKFQEVESFFQINLQLKKTVKTKHQASQTG